MSIEQLLPAVRDYLCAFDLMSIVVTADRRINGTRDVAGATGAWWCEAREVRRIIWLARKDGGDVPSAAQALGIAITEHATVLARTEAASH